MKSGYLALAKVYACLGLFAIALLCNAPSLAQPQAGAVSGTLGATGSDSMAGLMLRWSEALTAHYPEVTLQFLAGGSASAPTALMAGTTRLGPMSRRMTPNERDEFTARYGYPPLELRVARDALLIVVHRHNPLQALTRQQADAIFSTTLSCGAPAPIRRWEELMGPSQWPHGRIALHGRNLASGTYGLFEERTLCHGRFRPDISEYPGSSAVVAAVGESFAAMGYAGFNHLTPAVHALSLMTDSGDVVPAEERTIQSGDYPLSRYLYLYVNAPPGHPLPAAEAALIRLMLSSEGQEIVRAAGFVPLASDELERQRRLASLEAS